MSLYEIFKMRCLACNREFESEIEQITGPVWVGDYVCSICPRCGQINDNEVIDGPNKRPYRYKPVKLKNEKLDNWRCCCKCHKPGLFKWYSNAGKYSFSRFCSDCAKKVAQVEKIYLVGWDIDKFLDERGQK